MSGEQLAGEYEHGIDPKYAAWLAQELDAAKQAGSQMIVMVGGGNFVRGAQIAGHGIKRVTADHMGMLGTMINALGLTDIFEKQGVKTRCVSNIYAEQVAEKFVHRLVEKHLKRDRVVIVAGGVGRPYFTTDTAAVALGLELKCEIVLKATKVDGVYDKDPAKHKDAKKIDHLTHQQAVADGAIKIMDKAALGLAMEQKMPLLIFNAETTGNIKKASQGESIGTTIN